MTPSEIAKSYDQLAEQWNSDEFPRDNGIEQHKRALAFLKERRGPMLIILLAGGDKRTQERDIKKALELAREQ